jgi:hypothetical protein
MEQAAVAQSVPTGTAITGRDRHRLCMADSLTPVDARKREHTPDFDSTGFAY